MSRQQAFADELRRSMHDNLVRDLRLRQRSYVFPGTVINTGVFLRNLGGKSISAFTSHRIFAFFCGFFYMLVPMVLAVGTGNIAIRNGTPEIGDLWSLAGGVWGVLYVLIGLKITVNAILGDVKKPLPPKTYPRVKI